MLLGQHCALDPLRGGGNSSLRRRFHIHGGFALGGGKSSLLLSTARPGPYLLTMTSAGWARRKHATVGDKIELHSHTVDVSIFTRWGAIAATPLSADREAVGRVAFKF